MILITKALRLCKSLFKMPFIRANSIRIAQITLHSFRCWTALSCVASNRTHVQHTIQTPSIAEILPFWSFNILHNFLTRKQFYLSFLQSNRMDVLMLHCQIKKTEPHRWRSCSYQVRAVCRLLCYNKLVEFILWARDFAEQHRSEGHAICAAQHRHGCTQVNITMGHRLLDVQWSSGQGNYILLAVPLRLLGADMPK